MAVHPGGPRLYHSIPFHHLAQVKGGGGKAVNVALNVTPFVDMMTILVTFLLMVFSSSGELISAQRGLQLPDATQQDALKKAPILIVTGDAITFEGDIMADPKTIMGEESMDMKIPELFDRLRHEKQQFRATGMDKLSKQEKEYCSNPKPNPEPAEICLDGLLILQADKSVPAKVLNKVIKTANLAEFPNIMFAVNIKGTKAK
jgi:biopolymer transport protein ExbD